MENFFYDLIIFCAWGKLFYRFSVYSEAHWKTKFYGILLALIAPVGAILLIHQLPPKILATIFFSEGALFTVAFLYFFPTILRVGEEHSFQSTHYHAQPAKTASSEEDNQTTAQTLAATTRIELNLSTTLDDTIFFSSAKAIGINLPPSAYKLRNPSEPTSYTYIEGLCEALDQIKFYPHWRITQERLLLARLYPEIGSENDRSWTYRMLSSPNASNEDNTLAYQLVCDLFEEAPHKYAYGKASMERDGRGTSRDSDAAAGTCMQGIWACYDHNLPLTACSTIVAEIAWENAIDQGDRNDAMELLFDYCKHNPSNTDSWTRLLEMLTYCAEQSLTSQRVLQLNYVIHYLIYSAEDQHRNYLEEDPLKAIYDLLVALVTPDNFSTIEYFEFMGTDEDTADLFEENTQLLLDHGRGKYSIVLNTTLFDHLLSNPLWAKLKELLAAYSRGNVVLLN